MSPTSQARAARRIMRKIKALPGLVVLPVVLNTAGIGTAQTEVDADEKCPGPPVRFCGAAAKL